MVKKYLKKSEKEIINNLMPLLLSDDPETAKLGFELAKQEIDFNIGYKIKFPSGKKVFTPISKGLNAYDYINPFPKSIIVANYLSVILKQGYYWI